MRLAWLGPTPTSEGVPYIATQLLQGLARLGIEVDCFLASPVSALPEALRSTPGLRFFCAPSRGTWARPYGRSPLVRFVSGQVARALAQRRLPALIADQHLIRPYDLVYQFSQIEMLSLRRLRHRLPPIVLHPGVHAAGELRWHRLEDGLSKRCEGLLRRWAARAMLSTRARVQRSDVQFARMIVVPSHRMAELVAADYGLPPERIRVVPNPIDTDRFAPPAVPRRDPGASITLLFVSRMSVRKGVEMVVSLSTGLSDLAGRLRIVVAGGGSMWSDYRPLLKGLSGAVATYLGHVPYPQVPRLYGDADGLLQPSHYEPFALTVGEALASGLPVVASDAVGAVAGVDPRCCTVFPSGDAGAFESAVRELVDRLQGGEGADIRRMARSEAERLFSLPRVAGMLAESLEAAAGSKDQSTVEAYG